MVKLSFLLTAGLGFAGGFAAAKRLGAAAGGDGFNAEAGQRRPAQQTERIVHIARIRAGNEGEVRRLVNQRFPVSAMAVPGLQGLSSFVGSAYVLTEYAFTGEFTPVFTAFRNQPAVASYLQELGTLLDDEPAPEPNAPALQVLASQALHWNRTDGLTFTPHVRPREAAST
jgi:hypothetical protein